MTRAARGVIVCGMVLKLATRPNRLKVLRTERAATLQMIALAIGVSVSTIWKIEHGYIGPTPKQRKALAKLLGVTEADIWPEAA